MKIKTEQEKFGERLRLAIENAKLSHLKTSDIATRFNLRHAAEPVTPQAVYKWLNGLSIPSSDKIDTLAELLNISPQWLRYGISEEERTTNLSSIDDALIAMFLALTEDQKKIIIDVIRNFK
ncbi:MAG: helix-turn-helix domain-containing protein [[Pasteurella] mairii]|uniref:Helix-turn-helix domain n=1 Tax=[Pasteurella] mairii TaxID=757 RepID=A0A379B8B4_9PAST|nr:helix-turn-helix domain-containing protein [[Pasteurella] mairii]MDY4594249.1 helix-turn-helix domain-containing protein [[Pasteurella] aerogenes]SUB34320.1 Helix-turn-helix domain [[Pasteurella] mairii]